jgi:hypothetical protein
MIHHRMGLATTLEAYLQSKFRTRTHTDAITLGKSVNRGRHGNRGPLMLAMAFQYGLRIGELVSRSRLARIA